MPAGAYLLLTGYAVPGIGGQRQPFPGFMALLLSPGTAYPVNDRYAPPALAVHCASCIEHYALSIEH